MTKEGDLNDENKKLGTKVLGKSTNAHPYLKKPIKDAYLTKINKASIKDLWVTEKNPKKS